MSLHLLNGPVGQLEVLVESPEQTKDESPIVIICHPHPLYGGTMQNKVVHTLAKICVDMGMIAVRFNFRGVGQSEGHFEHGLGEQADCIAVADWVKQHYPQRTIWLAGFSFGSFVAYQSFKKIQAERLLLVAPPVGLFEFETMNDIAIPWTVIQGKEDEITPPESVAAWVKLQSNPARFYFLDNVSHFFHSKLILLREIVQEVWSN